MVVKVSALILLFLSFCVFSQTKLKTTTTSKSSQTFYPVAADDELSKHLSAAQTYQLTGDMSRAAVENQAVIAVALQRFGFIELEAEDFIKAKKHLSESAAFADDSLTRASLAVAYMRLNENEKAIAPLERQIKAEPKDNLIRKMPGLSYYFTKNFKRAVAALKPIELQLTDDVELSYFYGISLIQLRLNKDAELFFTKLLEKYPNDPQARFYAAQGFAISGNYERAIKEFRAVAAIVPQMVLVHYNAGQSLIRLNRFDEAEKEFRRELQLNHMDELAKYHLAFTPLEQKTQTDEAFNLLNEEVLTKPDYADAHYQLGKYLIEKAIEHLEKAVQFEPNKDYNHYQLSIAYRRASRVNDAEHELKIYRDLKAANRNQNSPMGN